MGNIGNGIIYPFGSTSNTFQVQDNLSYTRGEHAWKFGVELRRLQIGGPLDLFVNGQYSFSDLSGFGIPSSSSNPALEAFLKAQPFVFVGTDPALSDSVRGFRQTWFNGYAQDDWRVSPRITLNLGLRYDFYSNPSEEQDRLVNIRDVARDTAPTVGAIFGSVPKAMFSPRIGLAAIATSDQRTVVRGGFGTFRDQIWANLYANTRSLAPYYRAFFAILPTFNNPTQAAVVLPTANSTPEFEPEFPLVLQYNANVERQIGERTVVTVGYIGASGRNQPRMGEANPASAATGQRINPNFGSIVRYVMDAKSTYNALQLGYERRQTDGLMLNANYTYGHSRDNASLANPSDAVNETGKSQDLFDSEAEWGRSSFDVRHRFSLNATYDVPFGPGHRWGSDAAGWERVLEGWQLTAIVALQSNLPFTPIVGFDNAGTQSLVQSDRPDLVGDPYSGTCPNGAPVRTVTCWFNPSAFALPAPGTFGNAKRNSLDGPDYRTVDIGMLKTIGTGGSGQLQLRLEIFNLFNRANFSVPTNTAGPTGIGGNGDALFLGRDAQGNAIRAGNAARIFSTVGSSRQVQLGVRFRW